MGIRTDLDLMKLVLQYINDYRSGKMYFESLYLTVDSLLLSLSNFDLPWKSKALSVWEELEVIYAMSLSLEENQLKIDSTLRLEELKVPDYYRAGIEDSLVEMESLIHYKQKTSILFYCSVCGYDISDSPLWSHSSLSCDYCDCCGQKFYREPNSLKNIRECRDRWLRHPNYWHNQKAKPDDWKIENQMENISQECW